MPSLAAGTRLGAYEVVAAIGAGGMGEVYKARDTRLDRIVALKILPPTLAADPQFKDRFDREARALSALDHPHICALYDVGEQVPARSVEAVAYLVMQHLEGETLEARLKRGALPLEEALQIGTQVADALDKAHRAGVVHRDLKPGNIMLTRSGSKLLDFGLAKTTPTTSAGGPSMVPTTPPTLTAQGTILGTFQYMSPEQLEGLEADARSDIWAFGALFYEMATGKRAFEGKSQASLIAAIMHVDPPPLPLVQPAVSVALARVITMCLAKDPDNRWQSAADLWRELKWLAESSASGPATSRARTMGARSMLVGALGVVVGAAVAAGLMWKTRRPIEPPSRPVTRFAIALGPGEQFSGTRQLVAISHNGKQIAYVANQRIYLRSLDQFAAVPIRGVEGADVSTPFFSPDGQWLGFVQGGQIKKISISGGSPTTIVRGLTRGVWGAVEWGADDMIVFGSVGAVWRVHAAGGTPEPFVKTQETENTLSPTLLPGNRAVLYTTVSGKGVFVQALGGPPKPIVDRGIDARYLPTGHIVYALDDTLWALPFDAAGLNVTGSAVSLVENVRRGVAANVSAQFSISDTGSLVYIPGSAVEPRSLVWADRQGRETPAALNEVRQYEYVKIAPDGTRAALSTRGGGSDIWVWDVTKPTATRLTFEPEFDHARPIWTPDGRTLVFSWASGTPPNIFRLRPDGTGIVDRLTNVQANQGPVAVSPDGKTLVFREVEAKTAADLRVLALEGDHTSKPLLSTRFNEVDGDLSPDGAWLAYQSDETGRFEIFVRPFPAVDTGRWQISNGGGTRPLWSRDGRELFYVSGDDRQLMAAGIQARPTFSWGTPTALFEAPYLTISLRSWDVAADRRFLLIRPNSTESPRLLVVENWTDELRQRLPAK